MPVVGWLLQLLELQPGNKHCVRHTAHLTALALSGARETSLRAILKLRVKKTNNQKKRHKRHLNWQPFIFYKGVEVGGGVHFSSGCCRK